MKMHLFTIIQVVLLVCLLIIKSTTAALAFPLFVILLVPLRMKVLPRVFTEKELHEVMYHFPKLFINFITTSRKGHTK
jgi:hypothetical protein